jgi:serine/threonine-protein kinase
MLVGKQIGPFDVEKELGSGAMGAVFRARYTKTGQRVAIKVMSPSLGSNKTALARFEREGEILKQLKHPNIVRLFATGKFHGSPFYAMEYIEGESLDHVMARRGRMTWEEVITLGRQLCAALQHAHEQGIIHRDLKPSNLMVLADGTVKLTDFGIAKDVDVTQLTSANCTVGTASYMSPEQCKGERDLTLKSDLYSMGVVFYELITGKKPFRAETPMEIFMLHVSGKFERPSRLVLDLPIWLDTLICQLLEKSPEHRPLNAAAVGEALERILEKVEAQQSAGVDAVRARIADHPNRRAELDEEDKEAARTLLGKKKKRRKKKAVASYRRIWFKAAVLSVVLLAVGYLIFGVLLKKPEPEALFAQASKLMDSGNREDRLEAREGPIADFLKYYPKREDDHARQMHAWADEVDTEEQERRLLLWIHTDRITTDTERLASEAVREEDNGELEAATKSWSSLLENLESTSPRIRSWGLLAQKRLRDLDHIRQLDKELKERVQQIREQPKVYKPESTPRGPALLALYYEQFGDLWMAREQWNNFRSAVRKNPAQRALFVLGGFHTVKKLPKVKDEEEARKELVSKKMKEAADLMREEKSRAAKRIYKDILSLYESDTPEELTTLVKKARKEYQQIPAESRTNTD